MHDKISLKEKAAFALANLGNIPVQALIGSYLLIFYTNVVGLSPAACATLFLVARILDGLNDPLVGFMIDHLPRTRFGHFRPTLIAGTLLCSLNFLLLWFGPLMAPSGKLVIAYISYLLIGVLFPVMDISLNSMLPVMTENMEERNTLSSIKGFVYMVGLFGVNMVAPLILGNTSDASGYIRLIICGTLVIITFSIVGTYGIKERVYVEASENKYGVKDLFMILTRRPIYASFLSTLLFMVGMYIGTTVNTYFFTYVIDDLGLLSITSLVQLIALLPATLLVGTIVKKIGKKKLYVIGFLLYGVLPLIRFLDIVNVPLLMIATALTGIGMGFVMPLQYGINADNTDYVELESGYRAEAAIASLTSFIEKCGMGIGGAIPGYILTAVGFDAAAQAQSAGVNQAIILCVVAGPAALCLASALIFGCFYPLTKEKLEEQNQKVMRLRSQK